MHVMAIDHKRIHTVYASVRAYKRSAQLQLRGWMASLCNSSAVISFYERIHVHGAWGTHAYIANLLLLTSVNCVTLRPSRNEL